MDKYKEVVKEVYFDVWCESCEHCAKEDNEEPCDECLDHPLSIDSHKPVKWQKATPKKK